MSMYYSHTLIPADPALVPHPNQVRDFTRRLRDLEAAPINPILQVRFDVERVSVIEGNPLIVPITPGGTRTVTKSLKGRQARNPATGELLVIPRRDCTVVSDVEDLPSVLDQLEQYEFEMAGVGPAKLAVLNLNWPNSEESALEFVLRCCLSWEIVSTSDYHGDEPVDEVIMPFRQPMARPNSMGIFSNPDTLETIKVPGAGCSRFWIEFQFHRLNPNIRDSLNLLHPAVVTAAEETFGTRFAQGCRWG